MGLSHLSYVGQNRHIGLSVLVGQVGFHGTVPLVLRGTGGTEQTHRIECIGGTDRIPWDCPTCPTCDRWDRTDT